MTNVRLSCQCGEVTGTAHNISPKSGNRILCYCVDCRAYTRFLGKDKEMLDAKGGTDIFQMSARRLSIDKGKHHIKCVRLSPKGLMRWHTSCCNTALANTLASPAVPFAGVLVGFLSFANESEKEEVIGPVFEKVFGKDAIGGCPEDAMEKASPKNMVRSLFLLTKAFLSNRGDSSPFFDATTGQPIVEPIVISKEDRMKFSRD